MRTRPQRIALSRIVNTVITKNVSDASSALSASPLPDVPPSAEEEVNPWVGKTIRIGFSPYLSHVPITLNLEQTAQENDIPVEISQGSQEEIRQMFFNDELDLALVSLTDYFQRPESYISSDVCICSEGLVRSVLLYGRVQQPNQIKTIALYPTSETYVLMTKILMAERFDAHPEFIVLDKTDKWELTNADAVLLVGDRALQQPSRGDRFSFVWDMGQRWTQWTGIPFTYSFWLAKDKALGRYIAPTLSQTRDKGVEQLPSLALQGARRLKIDPEYCHDYLNSKLSFRLGGRQRKGVEIFCRLAKKHLLIDIGAPIPFNNQYRFRRREQELDKIEQTDAE
ncbi:MAG: menaquinone biosynthesis protein [Thermoguttaceae bacterium]|nr:menaquinone biosynthesis protein [Thermoguttaceae bacterium]